MPDAITTGWDLGGAHLKVAQIDGAGRLRTAQQLPCTLWRGLEHLTEMLSFQTNRAEVEQLRLAFRREYGGAP